MRTSCPSHRLPVAVTLALALAGCQQTDQELPFELAPDQGADVQIGIDGGTVGLPPSFALEVPANALTSPVVVTVQQLFGASFPSDAGVAVPGTAFDLQPVGTRLDESARVEIRVPVDALEEGQEARVSVAVVQADGSVKTYDGAFDLTSGVLSAEIDELGPIAAVITADAIAVAPGPPATLPGGSFPPPPTTVGPAPAPGDGVLFEGSCSPDARQCFSSGLVRLWADEVVLRRLGDDLFLLNPTVTASLDFIDFDADGVPTQLVGSVSVDGNLKARFNSSVSSYRLSEVVRTGPGGLPSATTLDVTGNVLVVGETTSGDGTIEFNQELEYGITGIGTSEMLIIELEAEIDFATSSGPDEVGRVTAHLRLRR